MKKLSLVLFTIILLIPVSCISPSTKVISNNNCIPPIADFAFPIKELSITPPAKALFSEEWIFQSSLPQSFYSYRRGVFFQGDIWLLGTDSLNKEAVLRYSPSTRTWKTYLDLQVEGGISGAFSSLYVSPDHSLWGVMSTPLRSSDAFSFPLQGPSPISHYNEQTDSFEYSMDADGILSNKIGRIYGITGDKNGSIWFTNNEGMYEYIPSQSALKTRIQTTKEDALQLLIAAPDGSIWAIRGIQNRLLHFKPETNSTVEYKVPYFFLSDETRDGLNELNKIYIDSENRLWMDDRGWVEMESLKSPDTSGVEDQVWYQVIRSPIFIEDNSGPYKYMWHRPIIEFEDAFGALWFKALPGVVKLNPDTGEWCKVAEAGQVMYDGKNVWLVYGTDIYLYVPKPYK